ncbi:hypothetical protein Tco_0018747 [Tanacetum coccineum]
MSEEVRLLCPAISHWAWYLDDDTIVGDTLVIGKVLELITKDGPRCGLYLNIDKTKIFWPNEDPRSKLEGVFPPNISRPLHGVKLLGGPVSVDPDFSSALVMKRASKTIGLLDAVAKINDPQCELLLIRACAGISKLYFAMRTCLPRVFESAQLSFDMALRSALERIVTASGPGFGDWQWRLVTLPFALGGLGVYSTDSGSTFDDCLFCMALWQSQREDHTSDWLRVVSISGLGQTMNTGKEVDIRLGGGCDKALHPADMLLYSWDEGLDVCVDLTGSSPLTQTGMADFVPGRVVIDAAQHKHGKYMAKCAPCGYWYPSLLVLPLAIHIFNRISFAIAKGIFVKPNMNTKNNHNCGLRKMTFLRSKIEHEASKVLQFKPQIKKQILMHESSKTRLLKTREKSDNRKAITTLMLGAVRYCGLLFRLCDLSMYTK